MKDARPERTEVVMQVDDGVEFARTVGVLDLLKGLELLAPAILVVPAGPQFSETTWARPAYRRFLPSPPELQR